MNPPTHPLTNTPDTHAAHGTPQRALLIWLFMVAATAFAWFVADHGMGGPLVVMLLFSLAYMKSALVILDFMAVRHAPKLWRVVMLGWLTAVCLLIGLAYWIGLNG